LQSQEDGKLNSDNTKLSAELRRAEEQVEARSAVFKKELGLWDLVLTQILFIVGLGWVGAAAKLGQAHIVFWLVAIVLFYIPSAVVVVYLNRLMPLEGGLYQWAKLGFNDFIGFLVAWNLWLYVIVLTSEIGLQVATNLSYALGQSYSWLASSKWFITLASCLVIGTLVLVSTLGLGIGKWVHNAGGVMMLVIFAALIILPIVNVMKGNLTEYHPLTPAMPALSLLSLNILGKMGFGALGGFEYMAILAGECREPVRAIRKSVILSAPIIALMFILGTSSVLAFLDPNQVDLIGPIPQVLSIGFRSFGIAARIIPLAILTILFLRVAQASVNFTANARLPMVAGWDRLLPEWFTRLHAKYKTPVNSILFVGAITLAMGLAGLIGVGEQEAFQLLQNAAGIFYALTYLVMFAIPVIGLRRVTPRPPLWLLMASVSGFLMTLLYVVLSVFPIIQVENQLAFTVKVASVIVIANLLGSSIFALAVRRRRSESEPRAISYTD
jgi:amino acid transporter